MNGCLYFYKPLFIGDGFSNDDSILISLGSGNSIFLNFIGSNICKNWLIIAKFIYVVKVTQYNTVFKIIVASYSFFTLTFQKIEFSTAHQNEQQQWNLK